MRAPHAEDDVRLTKREAATRRVDVRARAQAKDGKEPATRATGTCRGSGGGVNYGVGARGAAADGGVLENLPRERFGQGGRGLRDG